MEVFKQSQLLGNLSEDWSPQRIGGAAYLEEVMTTYRKVLEEYLQDRVEFKNLQPPPASDMLELRINARIK
jgi:hypothetical protein